MTAMHMQPAGRACPMARLALTVAACLVLAGRAPAQVAVSGKAAPSALPTWAFPHLSSSAAVRIDSITPRHVPHSAASFTDAQAADFFAVLDWHPELHPPMPAIVAHGRKPAVFACGYCHLAEGIGRPENAMLAGLPVGYILAQVAALRAGTRRSAWSDFPPGVNMKRVADGATTAEVTAAARYFSALRPRQRSQLVETTQVPRVLPGQGLYFLDPRGGTEPLGNRLVEVATSRQRHELHDALAGYVTYVPPGSVERGRTLATVGRSGTLACAVCHGAGLRGMGDIVPPLAGRSPSYLLRQLLAFKSGSRSAPAAAPMRAEATSLVLDDMIAVAAYAGSLKP